ncbi:MAG: aldehyde dehydrogenase family protein [Thermoguttaceae bacterium]
MPDHFALMIPAARAAAVPGEVRSPLDQSLIATFDQVDLGGAQQALAAAERLFRNRDAWLGPARRIEILRRAADLMQSRRDHLAREAAREGGKPLIDSLVETDRAVDSIRLCVEHLRSQAGEEIPMGRTATSGGRLAFTQLEPIGPVLAFSAFNHPLNLIAHQVGPALAAGCPVVVKPAKSTPLSCFRLVHILREAGLPDEWCQPLVTNDHHVAEQIVADSRVAFFTFIGSDEVGWRLRRQLAPGTRCSLEHGGVAPVIVAVDADLDYTVPLLVKGSFYHAGQVCVSVQRIFADRRIARTLAARIASMAEGLKVGDPTHLETEVGPLIRPDEVTRVDQWVQEAVQAGAELLCGGRALPNNCYAPAVLFDPPASARVMQREVFGPVVCVSPFDSLDEAIARANALSYAFQAAVFTRGLDTALRAARRLDASAVMVNDHTAFRVDWMPFGGLRQSGLGVGGIPHTMAEMQVKKMIVIRSKEL